MKTEALSGKEIDQIAVLEQIENGRHFAKVSMKEGENIEGRMYIFGPTSVVMTNKKTGESAVEVKFEEMTQITFSDSENSIQ